MVLEIHRTRLLSVSHGTHTALRAPLRTEAHRGRDRVCTLAC